ncbi:SAM-dependent methyltransferase [Alkalimonas mucilaginosa]|uniref:SAM-dependent methyltransferase n=1 Tax=Alkalimonas mucilaginosa TaxID=3057676 RepID=A0ABU7JEI1_9GAMM|nr:SAM-dependent methyltransferase [Alkalimonas sp. MEB004]MEE2023778.1 SAM-dependent methyltransferase [Alkalimonas sp. MEB004]
MQQGSLVCVGTGMTLGSHISPLSRNYIEQADVVFVLVADGITEQWIESMNSDVRSLQPFYLEGKSRLLSYKEMVAVILAEVRAGKKVVGAFYGHPGVFAWVPHKAIATARAEGYQAHMEPGISAEDCLYADLGIDPGTYGCQHYEASQFMFYHCPINPSAYLVLWQVGVAGDKSLARFSTDSTYRALLVEALQAHYSQHHQVILYEAICLSIQKVRIETLPLKDLPHSDISLKTTLIIPPANAMRPNHKMLQRLAALEDSQTQDV